MPLDLVHGTRPGRSGGRRSSQLHLHRFPLEPDEVALVVADSALHRGIATDEGIRAVLDRGPRRHGTAAALRVLALADGRAESPGESRSRWRIRSAGLPAPDLQVPVFSGDGEPLGRADFGWDGVVGEFDGRVMYGRLLRPGQDPGDVVFAEKVPEDGIQDGGTRVVRWIWDELHPFDGLRRRLSRALGSA